MRNLMILAHGQPSDPLPAAAELEGLASLVAAHLPDWRVLAATLAEPGALERLAGEPPGMVFPVFMAAGWFTRVAVPSRLEAAGLTGWRQLAPMGMMETVQDLAVRIAAESGAAQVLVAAHGSGRSPAPAEVARKVAGRIAAESGAVRVECAFIEEAPFLRDVSGWGTGAVCLPFFAMAGGHVLEDLPEALREAAFPGRILPALGLHPDIPGLIARAALEAGCAPQ
ncbi:CbiX/SirB N-terminal domain-containing protein [Pseudogemmobacter bohemicus]|uniref:CbiX/SirB N-terminal domain-containing protein n=1 Tax=Pseudogemmobacter bohemicus TaxID=2250708 RepID=UPI000DD426B1|nr:CbiX/SirB N-terminal domain-containing protein [Pseudogemmobacter bohemicus]